MICIMSDSDGTPQSSDSPSLGGAKRGTISGQEPELSGARPRVLILDDMSDNLQLYASLMEFYGWGVTGVQHGDLALQQLQSEQWDLFITDIMHPGAHTVMLCRFIRSQPATHLLPILVVSADERGCEEINKYYRLRVVCLSKPIVLSSFMQVVREALTASRRGEAYPAE
jgi:CheY-like chemotaxis protein